MRFFNALAVAFAVDNRDFCQSDFFTAGARGEADRAPANRMPRQSRRKPRDSFRASGTEVSLGSPWRRWGMVSRHGAFPAEAALPHKPVPPARQSARPRTGADSPRGVVSHSVLDVRLGARRTGALATEVKLPSTRGAREAACLPQRAIHHSRRGLFHGREQLVGHASDSNSFYSSEGLQARDAVPRSRLLRSVSPVRGSRLVMPVAPVRLRLVRRVSPVRGSRLVMAVAPRGRGF
jgi:hypothetical protein